jgi:predicted nucleic acid-binding protein
LIVLDASVVVELLINGEMADVIGEHLAACDDSFIVPHVIDVEVLSAIRRITVSQPMDAHRTGQFRSALAGLPAERYSHTPSLDRIWELRHNFTAGDATYIALAEATGAALYTFDE